MNNEIIFDDVSYETMNEEQKLMRKALATHLHVNPEQLVLLTYTHYDLVIFRCLETNDEYAIGDDIQAFSAASAYILDSLWAFNTEFIAKYTLKKLNDNCIKAIKLMQTTLCEDANDIIEALIHKKTAFIIDAIKADGRGHFLNPYDSNEYELENGKYFAYRLN